MLNFSSLRRLLPLPLLLGTLVARAQVGIGTTTPNASAALDVVASGKGLLIPRLDSMARVGITSPATGLLVFQTSPRVGFYYYGGSGWLFLPDKGRGGDNLGNHTATQPLNLQGNALTGSGADIGSTVGVGIRTDGGLNLGQNTNGNLYLGYQAGRVSTSSDNVFVGYQSGYSNTSGSNSQFSGYQSGYYNTTGHDNLFSGYQSGYSNTTGNYNLFSGTQSGYSNTTGGANLFNGYYSGHSNTSGSHNLFSGYYSGYSNTTGTDNLFSGFGSGYSNTTGTNNLFSGTQSGFSNTTGSSNVFSGNNSGYSNTTGSFNVFSGTSSGRSNTTGSQNLFSGFHSGYSNTTGSQNVFSGYQSGFSNASGSNNQFSGYQSGFYNTSGADNLFRGSGSGFSNTTGSNNLFSGTQSGYNNTTGSSNVALGYQAGPSTGGLTNATALGANAVVSQSNSLVLGGTGPDAVNVGIGTSAPLARLDVQGGADSNGGNDPVALALAYRNGGFRHWLRSRHNSTLTSNDNALDVYLNNGSAAADSQAPGLLTAANPTGAGAGTVQVLSLTQNAGSPRVGIGTAAPAATLDVAGPVRSSAGGFQFPDGTTQTTAVSSADFIQNRTSQQAGASFNVGGSGTIGGAAAIGGSLRLGVRVCPVNTIKAYRLTAADIAYSIFKLVPAATAGLLILPPPGTGQVEGQELTVFNLNTTAVVIDDANTDNTTSITLDAIATNGIHAVRFVWVTQPSQGYWVRVQ